jgi:cytochrome c5
MTGQCPSDQEERAVRPKASVMKGMGAMAPKRGNASQAEVKAAVDDMISQAK